MAGLTKVKGSGLATGAATDSLVGIDDNATSTKLSISNDGVSIGRSTPYGLSTTLLPASEATDSDHINIQLKIGEVSQNAYYYNAIGYVLHPTHGHCGSMQSISGGNPGALLLNNNGGQVRVGSGGITFNGDTAAANALDDYEEGTWTPSQGTGLTVVGTFSSSGNYTKIGRLVFIEGQVSGSTSVALATTDRDICTNNPFTPTGSLRASGLSTSQTLGATAGFSIIPGTGRIITAETMAATTKISFSATYIV